MINKISIRLWWPAILSLLILIPVGNAGLSAMEIIPEVVGNGSSDSIVLTFETFDTTSLPVLANPDSLKILRFGPSGNLVDSIGEDAGNLFNPRTGSYEAHYRGSNNSASRGRYIIRVYAFKGGQIRGASSGGYYVKQGNWDDLDSTRNFAKAVLDTLNNGFASQTNQANLDAAVSSRSTLTEEDNIGIDWLDIENAGAAQAFPSTILGGVSAVLSNVNVDTGKISRSVWNDDVVPISQRIVDLSACSGGSGAIPCSLYVFNSADSSAMQGIRIRFMNEGQNATEALGVTNSSGRVVVSLDEATYRVWGYKAGTEFSGIPHTLVVSEPAINDTIWGSVFEPGDPVSPELCRTYGWVSDLSGNGISGVTVMARIEKTPIRYMGTIISPYYKSTSTDSLGYWELDLLPNSVLDPADSKYEFEIYYEPGRIARKKVIIPDQAGWELDW